MPTDSVNYTATGTDFFVIDNENEPIDPTEGIKKLQLAVEEHTHASTRGLAVRRLQGTQAAGSLPYGLTADTLSQLAIGTAGQLLAVNAGATAPEWTGAWTAFAPTLTQSGAVTV